ncbi:ferredoxin [Streptomyces longisporoflavus]|uniref:ferredoxin n=1 Tax=Streptomyces longisporoflavus TaxID=28044 RepID=UPI00167D5241|nr:ferredoxin [Streptomyces longisporoflavus]GGV37154.1 ferredoxin [Streptomyces longisporoflavus]
MLKVTVDLDVCQDHGQCVFAAPDVFELDDDGRLAYVGTPDESLRADVEDAADVCPLQAIRIEG